MTARASRNGIGHLLAAGALLVTVGCQQAGTEGATGGPAAGPEIVAAQIVVVPTGQACTPSGKHFEHRSFACTACHLAAGALCFDPTVAGPTAAFDAVTKNCSSIACHGTAAGTFTYTQWDWGLDQGVEITVPYGGAGGAQANWYASAGLGCNACHGYPPTYNGVPYTWHSGAHGGGNTCQLCHPDASGAYVFGGQPVAGTITNATLHRNGTVNVSPQWTSACFGCH